MARILIAGCGNIGGALGRTLARHGHFVAGLKRLPPAEVQTDVEAGEIHYIRADLTSASDISVVATDFDQVIYIVTPSGFSEDAYQAVFETGLANLLSHFRKHNSQASFMLTSSTSVYGQNRGEWVDENSQAKPLNFRGDYQLIAENQVLADKGDNTVVRFSGIYGPGRFRLLQNAETGIDTQKNPPLYTNRIHAKDCVGVLDFLIRKKIAGETLQSVYLASDDNPAPTWEVMCWLADQLKVRSPGEKTDNDGFQNKRCRNRRVKALGYCFKYPGYREGYPELIKAYRALKASKSIIK